MAKEITKSIRGVADFELQRPRSSKLQYTVSLPEAGPLKGLVFVIPGFGEDNNSAYNKKLREYIADQYSLVSVTVRYHCQGARFDNGAEKYLAKQDIEQLVYLANIFKFQLSNSWAENMIILNREAAKLKNKNKHAADLFLDQKLNISLGVSPAHGEYQNFGVMQAIDHIYVLYDLLKNIHFDKRTIIAFGSSHGGYIANLMAKFAPNTFSAVIDNSSYAQARPRYLVGRDLQKIHNTLPCNYSTILHTIDEFPHLIFSCFVRSPWTLSQGKPGYYSLDRERIRSFLYQEDIEQMSQLGQAKTQYRFYHSKHDTIANVDEKMAMTDLLTNNGFDCQMRLFGEEDIDGKLAKNLEHGMGLSLKRMFSNLIDTVTPREGDIDIELKSEIVYQGFDWEYCFNYEKDSVIPYCCPRPGVTPIYSLVPQGQKKKTHRVISIFENALSKQMFEYSPTAETISSLVLQEFPYNHDALHQSGICAFQKGFYSLACHLFQQAITLDSDIACYHFNLGSAHEKLDNRNDAFAAYLKSIELDPDIPMAQDRLLRIVPTDPNLLFYLGNMLHRRNKLPEAIVIYRRLIAIRPAYPLAYNNLGSALEKAEGPIDEVVDLYRQAIQLAPNNADIHYNLGVVLLARGETNDSLQTLAKCLSINPDYVLAHIKCADANLLMGNFKKGWSEYRWRMKMPGWEELYPHIHKKPSWNGSPFHGKRLLVHGEQGFGDTIQFIRYLPLVKKLGGEVIFETRKELLPLLENFPGIDNLIERDPYYEHELDFDLFVHTLTLPEIFDTTLETIPENCPYLFATPEKEKFWKERISGKRYKVGIVWEGSTEHTNDHNRSCQIELLLKFNDIQEVCLYSLQKGGTSSKLLDRNHKVIDLGKKFVDFTDTAGAIANLDLIITVDTSVAHLAGAMNKKVWVLLPFSPDWRWMLGTASSPWYPCMKLFRQEKPREWKPVIDDIIQDLQDLVKNDSNCKHFNKLPN